MSADGAAWPWQRLGLDGPSNDARAVRRAYALQLKSIDASSDVEAFEALRQAYEIALELSGNERSNRHNQITSSAEITRITSAQRGPRKAPTLAGKEVMEAEEFYADDAVGFEFPQSACHSAHERYDREAVNTLVDTARKLIRNRDFGSKAWEPLFFSAELYDPQASMSFENDLVRILTEIHSPEIAKAISGEFSELADTRFGWVSDGIGFLARHPDASSLQSDLSGIMRQHLKRVDLDPRGKSFHPLIWITPILVWASLLAYLH